MKYSFYATLESVEKCINDWDMGVVSWILLKDNNLEQPDESLVPIRLFSVIEGVFRELTNDEVKEVFDSIKRFKNDAVSLHDITLYLRLFTKGVMPANAIRYEKEIGFCISQTYITNRKDKEV